MEQRRREFGALLRGLRLKRGVAGAALAAKAGKISRTTLASIECGKRQAGAKVSERLADALELVGEKRDNFLMAALRTTASEFLPQKAAGLDPQLLMPIWKILPPAFLVPDAIKRISRPGKQALIGSPATMTAVWNLAKNAQCLVDRLGMIPSGYVDSCFDLEIETRDGKIMLIKILAGES